MMFTPEHIDEAHQAAYDANTAKIRMDQALIDYDIAKQEFDSASKIAGLVFRQEGESLLNPLDKFIEDETKRIIRVNGKEAAGNISLSEWTKAFDARSKIAKQLPVKEEDFHIVLSGKPNGPLNGVNLMYMAIRGIRTRDDNSWKSIMSKATEKMGRKYTVELDGGQILDSRLGMTKQNYEAMIKHARIIDRHYPIDKFVPPQYGIGERYSGVTRLHHQPWMTGEPSFIYPSYSLKYAALIGIVENGVIRYGHPSTTALGGYTFRPCFIISESS